MSDHSSDPNGATLTEKVSCVVSEPSLKFLQLVSIFETEESDTKLKLLSQRRLTAAAAAVTDTETDNDEADKPEQKQEVAIARDGDGAAAGSTSASGVAVTNYANRDWLGRPERNLLVVIHPWCMLRKSNADRQSEFPPPGFLERLKAKLMALHRETDAGKQRQCPAEAAAAATSKRRRNNNQRIKYWVQYTAAVAAAAGLGGSRAKTIAAKSVATPCRPDKSRDVVDFLAVRKRYATP